jgi:hypothetical protein
MENQFFQGFGLKLEGVVALLFGFGVVMHYLKLPYSAGDIVMILATVLQLVYACVFIDYKYKKGKRENWIF